MKLRVFTILVVAIGLALFYMGFRLGRDLLGMPAMDARWITWMLFLLGYAVCSGANVAYFAFSERELRRKVERGNDALEDSCEFVQAKRARSLLRHLDDPNWTLAAILLTNVAFGVQLSQLSEELFAGIMALLMPIIAITIFGEFFAQATFLRWARPICHFFSPFVWLLKWVTSPISYPLARAVDALYGREALRSLNEQDLLSDLRLELTEFGDEQHPHSEILDRRELTTLMNAAQADDEPARDVGDRLDPETVVPLSFEHGRPVFPEDVVDFALHQLERSAHPWFVITDRHTGDPQLLLDADGFVRDLFRCLKSDNMDRFFPCDHTFRVHVYRNADTKLGEVISGFLVHEEYPGDDVIDIDVALLWTPGGRWIVTGGDILGRLLRGVARRRHWRFQREERRRARTKTS